MFEMKMGSVLFLHKLCTRSAISYKQAQNYLTSFSKAFHSSLVNHHHLLKLSSPAVIPSRTFWETFPIISRSLHEKDGLDKENHELVYRSKMFNYVFYAQLISQFTFSVQLGASSYYALSALFLKKFVPALAYVGPFPLRYDFVALGVITVFTLQNALMYIAAQRCLLRVYHKKDTDEYIFISLRFNPTYSRHVKCKPGELECLNVKNFLAVWGNYEVKERKYYIRQDLFKHILHYNRLRHGADY